MSVIRRAAVVSVLAAALVTGAAGAQAFAASAAPATIGDFDGPGRGHDRPIMFGPFEIPRNGSVGFHWGTSNRGGGMGF
ncbi:hypothetical protein ABZ135_32080 [Streptomyces sp. NPDC006339]|uniref:hypothetical protein n=1 Tax=Streptomyces sp. NPDC006339 TaxID=3156755 RepID=UPI0033A29DE8